MVYNLKYIGPFLRINNLNVKNVENQLFHLSKESIKYIVLNSKCGITIPISELKLKNDPNIDISTLDSFSPLLCVYKKANIKLKGEEGNFFWDEDSFKKDVNITGNALMTLSILELVEYYNQFSEIDNLKHYFSQIYLTLAKRQLEFYASYLRNAEGVFVDKKNVSHPLAEDLEFTDKSNKFRFSDQALLMAAYYKYSCYDDSKTGNEYRSFSSDILNMFMQFKDDLYALPADELSKLCLGLNIFYRYSKQPSAKTLLLDLSELLFENSDSLMHIEVDDDLESKSLLFINSMLLHNNCGYNNFKELSDKYYEKLLSYYSPEQGMFVKGLEKKEITLSCTEIMLYLLSFIMHSRIEESDDDNAIIRDVFKRHVISSGIIPSWPGSPNIDDVERYRNFSSKSDDLLDEQDFRMSTIPTPENCELASIFLKYINYNRKKESFSASKQSFDCNKNMFIFFLLIYLKDYPWNLT